MNVRPLIHTIYSFTCSACGKNEVIRWPLNPMQETPDLHRSVPQGWLLVLDGDQPQNPIALCGCKEQRLDN